MGRQQDPEQFGIGRLFYLTSEAIIAADIGDERIVLWNPAAERLLGYPTEEALGMRLDALVPSSLRDRHLVGLRRYRDGAEPVLVGAGPVVVPAVTKSGDARDVALSLTEVSHDGRSVVLAVLRDVTEQLRAERALASANEAMRDFVATASHDLRSPLTSVLGFTQLLLAEGDAFGEEQRREMLESVERSAAHASRLVEDLLTLSRIQASELTPAAEPVRVVSVARAASDETGAAAVIEVPDHVVVLADPDHVRRMLVNFLSNALRYGAPPVRVHAQASDHDVEVRVCDGGPGVPDAFAERLFTPFARAEPGTRDGTGLGLSIVKGLAVANGGRAFYERCGLGSCFGVVLPRA